ncbi:MAG: Cof-type HAD-IIB family hydrolase [Ruminococcus sp.]
MDIKLIAIDLDGTLLDSGCVFREENRIWLSRALKAGYFVVPTTGRSFQNARYEIFKNFDEMPYYINANGTVVTDGKTEKVLYTASFPRDVAKEIYRLCKEYRTYIEPYAGRCAYMEREGIDHLYRSGLSRSYCEQLMRTNILTENMEEIIANGEYPVSKFHIVCESSQEKEMLKARIAAIPGLYPISVVAQNIEVVYQKKSKKDGLAFLSDYLGITRENVLAIGDSSNDIEMLEWAGCSVAMENASDQVKKTAKYVTDTNDNDGVAKALQRFLTL